MVHRSGVNVKEKARSGGAGGEGWLSILALLNGPLWFWLAQLRAFSEQERSLLL